MRSIGKVIAIYGAFLTFLAMPLSADDVQKEDDAFTVWLEALKNEAVEKGISAETVSLALNDAKLLEKVISNDRNQPEIKQIYASYFKSRISEWRKEKGKEMLVKHADLFKEIGAKYGVQPRYIAAIWGLETNFGTFELKTDVFDALVTLAYDKRRGDRFRPEVFAALEILDKGYATLDQMKSSWAGAMGQPQFMPVNYLKLAVDHDGDGHRDIWSNEADVIASIAFYLQNAGWKANQIWGRPVMLPDGGEETLPQSDMPILDPSNVCKRYKSIGAWRKLKDWNALGVRRLNGGELPDVDISAALVMGDLGDDKGYIVYDNFCSIMRYNPAFKYALAVGMLGDTFKSVETQ